MSTHTSISSSQLRQQIKTVFDEVSSTRVPLRVRRRNGEDMIVLPLSDYEALDETAYLLRSPANAERLHQALENSAENRSRFDSVQDIAHALGD